MKKSRKFLLILAFVVLLGLIHMPNKAFAAEEVYNISIGANFNSDGVSSVNLVLGEHETEQLKPTAKDSSYHIIEDATFDWTSSDESIVSVSSSGLITAKKEGTATITATAGNESKSVEVKVSSITFADFSDVEYKWNAYFKSNYYLQLLSNKAYTDKSGFYFTITKNNEKPKIVLDENCKIKENESRSGI